MSPLPLKVVELFAGVGGFRIALEGYPKKNDSPFEVVWSNQFEPKTKKQHASMVYEHRFGTEKHSNIAIEKVVQDSFTSIPNHDLLVGGFPCQDFSVANRSHNRGLEGSKGKLWWSIIDLIKKKAKKAPKYLFLENVDRLLISPTKQRGRDFAVILASLNALGYAVEWRVINAADYGFPQRRRRVYILAYKKGTALYQAMKKSSKKKWLACDGVSATAFPCTQVGTLSQGAIPSSSKDVMLNFSNETNRFKKAGAMIDGIYYTCGVKPVYCGTQKTLGDVLIDNRLIPDEFFITKKDIPKWKKVKGAMVKKGINQKTGIPYVYRQGNVAFPDCLRNPSRTIVTKEGGSYISREKHAICVEEKYRRLHPIELERLNGFPDDFTQCDGISNTQRAFFMGNALVVGVVQKLGVELAKRI